MFDEYVTYATAIFVVSIISAVMSLIEVSLLVVARLRQDLQPVDPCFA